MNTARAPSHFSPGGLLDGGKYRIIRRLGAGGMGEVFEAQNTLTRKRVAIKCLHAGRAANPDATARLLREAEAASRIRHPHVVDVYDVGRDADSVFLVMEYMEGEPLSQLLARGGMPMHALIALLLPAMRAVAEAHRQGVVHRDIKPDNIFLAREADAPAPVPKVLDFGISKLSAQDGPQASLTLSGSTLGTPRYMAYEQLMSDKSIDGRVDVYAFGVILYEALTGRPPFDAETYPELIVKIAHGVMTPPKQLRAELPSTLDRLVCWALERDRDRRVASMEELIRELEPFATERGMLAEMTVAEREGAPLSAIALNSTVRSKPPTRAGAAVPVQLLAADERGPRRWPWVAFGGLIALGVAWLVLGGPGVWGRSRNANTDTVSVPLPSAATDTEAITDTSAITADQNAGGSAQPGKEPAKGGSPLPAADSPARTATAVPSLPAADARARSAAGALNPPPTAADLRAPTPASTSNLPLRATTSIQTAREQEAEAASHERAPTTRAARRARSPLPAANEPNRAESAADTPDKPVEAPAPPPPPAATPTPARTQETPAPAPSTFRVKLPQSKEF